MNLVNLIDTYINVICEDKIYIIKSGDTLSAIAKKYKTTVEAIMKANGLADENKIIDGNKLIIPISNNSNNSNNPNTIVSAKYKVKSGDSLSVIAKKYKVSIQQLMKLNNIKNKNFIKQGMTLLIPIRNRISNSAKASNKKQENVKLAINNSQQQMPQKNITGGDWIQSITMPFIIKWQGKIVDANGNHVVYDDDVNTTNKNRWDGEGQQQGINNFIQSCIGKATIGYGETGKNIVIKGTISDAEAKSLLINRLKNLDKFLSKKYKHYNRMNPNQRTALISFSYNLGRDFIQNGTKKMKAYLYAGKLDAMCSQMHDCDNVTQNGQLIKVQGLTKRRQDQMALFRTPYKK